LALKVPRVWISDVIETTRPWQFYYPSRYARFYQRATNPFGSRHRL